MLDGFLQQGKASFVLGGQFGSEGKGAASAWLVTELAKTGRAFDIISTNAGVQSGHTSIHEGQKRVLFHLPTAALIAKNKPWVVLNAGSVIDPDVLEKELYDNQDFDIKKLLVHPNACVITDECREAEMRSDSAQTKIASTRKGVGVALSCKVLRSGMIAKDHPFLAQFVRRMDLSTNMRAGCSALIEIPQGVSLSLNSRFYPHTTSRDCTVGQAMSDAGIHPHFVGDTMLVLRTFPIRVGNIKAGIIDGVEGHHIGKELGHSGSVYPDQQEISFDGLGVEAEITTVTKRVRRIFTWSNQQIIDALTVSRPSVIFLTFCDYLRDQGVVDELVKKLRRMSKQHGIGNRSPEIICAWGPSTADAQINESRYERDEG